MGFFRGGLFPRPRLDGPLNIIYILPTLLHYLYGGMGRGAIQSLPTSTLEKNLPKISGLK